MDDNFDVSADLTWDVYDAGASFGQLKAGFQLIYRERDSDSVTYGFNVNQVRDDLLRTENLLVSDVVYICDGASANSACESGSEGGISTSPNTGLVFVDKTLASDSYDAELEYNSAYLMYDHTFDSVWQVILGVATRPTSKRRTRFLCRARGCRAIRHRRGSFCPAWA